MMVSTRGSVLRLLAWQWKYVVMFTLAGALAVLVNQRWPEVKLPAMPLGIVGGALGIFVSFRTNQAYSRWWEGRQLWGRLINSSRTFASQTLAYLPADGEGRALAETMVRRQVTHVHALRVLLRGQDLAADADVTALLVPGDNLAGDSNPTYLLVHKNIEALALVTRRNYITGEQMLAIDESLRTILDVQGGCERIKRTPMPRGYAFIASRVLAVFALALPFALIGDMGVAAIPVSTIVCLAFALISEAGRVLEDPFTMFWNALPLTQMARTIEVNLRQRLGDTDLPAIPGPDAAGVLM